MTDEERRRIEAEAAEYARYSIAPGHTLKTAQERAELLVALKLCYDTNYNVEERLVYREVFVPAFLHAYTAMGRNLESLAYWN